MAMKLHELHPALVHAPLALFPIAIGADLVGRATGNDALMALGKKTLPLAVASGLVAGVAGLMAQTEVEADGVALDVLKTHRTLNLATVAATAALAAHRNRTERPTLAYLAAGVGALAVMTFSAYLGGEMVYKYGVGVKAADGVRKRPAVPELKRKNAARALKRAGADLAEGIKMTAQETAKGDLVPSLKRA
jgi:uncharacterized membrane protein